MSENGAEGPGSVRPTGYATAITSNDRLVHFLYVLMRDHIPAGAVEEIVCIAEQVSDGCAYSNDFLAAYAHELVARLGGTDPAAALVAAQALVPRDTVPQGG